MSLKKSGLSNRTCHNWLVAILLTLSSLLVALSGMYFLFLPNGGYQGGRNLAYGIVFIFTRATWDLIHTWAGVVMIVVATIHIPLHWSWITTMTKRIFRIILGQCEGMNSRGQFNLMLNAVIGLSGSIAAISGLYFLFFPGPQGRNALSGTAILFSRAAWDVIHTWSGVVTIAAAILHFAIHWHWIRKVTGNLLTYPLTKYEDPASQNA